jgi:uncharacterized repeat protein (TIGR03803 family)
MLLRTCAIALASGALLSGCSGPNSVTSGAPLTPSVPAAKRAASSSERVIYNFTGGNDGGDPATGLTIANAGNLYGTTVVGGASSCGTVFELRPLGSPSWQEKILYSFGCYADGKNPYGGVTFDSQGNIYGTTVSGGSGGSCGSSGCGVVYKLGSKSETVLHSFAGGTDGFGPGGPVAFNSAGELFGTTPDGGKFGDGVVYELTPHGRTWSERVIHAFTGGKGGSTGSLGSLLIDASGNLYGVTELAGAHDAGTVYRLSPATKNKWKFTTLYAFRGEPDAGSPYGGLIADSSGNLYGTTYYGGANGEGAVFELVAKKHGRYRERVLYSFKGGNDGSSPTSTLLLQGNSTILYGTTSAGGGSCGCGTIFTLDAASGKESVLYSFSGGSDGAYPYYGLTIAADGTMYGTTVAGGTSNQGTIYEFAL